jgi:hypothetical protein
MTMPQIGSEWSTWHKSSLSGQGECVEVRRHSGGFVQVRDSKAPDSGVLSFTPREWIAFIGGVKAGEFDPPDGS